MPRDLHASLMKPFVALATPGMYLFYKYNQYKRQQQEQNRRKVTERELQHLNHKIDKLLAKLEEHEPELATSQDEECVVCISAKASMQTYPCGHKVVCRKCFVKTIQMAVSQRLLPLQCVICRTKILRLKQSTTAGSTSSGSSIASGGCSSCSSSSRGLGQSHSSHPITCASVTRTASSASVNVPHHGSNGAVAVTAQRPATAQGIPRASHRGKSPSRPHQVLQQQHPSTAAPLPVLSVTAASKRKSVDLPREGDNAAAAALQQIALSNSPTAFDNRKRDAGKGTPSPPKGYQRHIRSNYQPVVAIKDYLVPSPDIIYFKPPTKEKSGSRKNLLRPNHKLPSLPKVMVRSRSSSKCQEKK